MKRRGAGGTRAGGAGAGGSAGCIRPRRWERHLERFRFLFVFAAPPAEEEGRRLANDARLPHADARLDACQRGGTPLTSWQGDHRVGGGE